MDRAAQPAGQQRPKRVNLLVRTSLDDVMKVNGVKRMSLWCRDEFRKIVDHHVSRCATEFLPTEPI